MKTFLSLAASLLICSAVAAQTTPAVITMPPQQSGGLLSRLLNRTCPQPTQAIVHVPRAAHQTAPQAQLATMHDVIEFNYKMQHLAAIQAIAANTASIRTSLDAMSEGIQDSIEDMDATVDEQTKLQLLPHIVPKMQEHVQQIQPVQPPQMIQPQIVQPQVLQPRVLPQPMGNLPYKQMQCPGGQCPMPSQQWSTVPVNPIRCP